MLLPSNKLVWVDLEFTDLDVDKGVIVEISTVITNYELEIIARGPTFVINQPEIVLKTMGSWCKDHFNESGLLAEIKTSKVSLKQAMDETLSFIKKHCSMQTALLAGSAVHMDRLFLLKFAPEIVNYLHHRVIDVSTIKDLANFWYPDTPRYPKNESHRAEDDILESIDELKYYRSHIFK